MSSYEGKLLYEDGSGLQITIELGTDSMSIFTSLSAAQIRPPQEKTLGVLLHWLKEKLMKGIIRTLRWYDTRDMSSDGHTKGSVERTAILNLMNGHYRPEHETKEHSAPARI